MGPPVPPEHFLGWGQVPREAVALVKPVTSAPRPSVRPTAGEEPGKGGRDKRAGVQVY